MDTTATGSANTRATTRSLKPSSSSLFLAILSASTPSTSSTVYPDLSTAALSSAGEAAVESYSTTAFPSAKLIFASTTPGTSFSASCTASAHVAQCMPPTVMVSSSLATSYPAALTADSIWSIDARLGSYSRNAFSVARLTLAS